MEPASNELKCYCCHTAYTETDKFCGNCGYPFQASQEEKKQFSINYSLNHYDKDVVKDRVKEARVFLYVISGFTVIQTLILFASQPDPTLLVVNLILAAIYAGLAFWARQKAFAAILTGGLLYVSIILLSAVLDPASIIKGIVFKVIFTIGFIRAAYGAYKFKL